MVTTELRYSWMYNSVYVKSFKKKDMKKLQQKCKPFGKLYNKHIKEILKLIPKYFLKWKKGNMPIYIIEKGPVFADPITIRYEKDPKLMLLRLIHELIHNNLEKKKFKSDYLLHIYMNKKTGQLLGDLSIDLKEHFWVLERMAEKIRRKK